MRYIAAYILAVMGGKSSPNVGDVTKILNCVGGIDVDSEKLGKVLSGLRGKKLDEIIATGRERLATIPTAVDSGSVKTVTIAPIVIEEKKETKKEIRKEESESESDNDMGFGLFD